MYLVVGKKRKKKENNNIIIIKSKSKNQNYVPNTIFFLNCDFSCETKTRTKQALGFLIKFKHMIALTNDIQTMLSFSRIFKFNAVICLNSIKESNVPNLRNFT